MEIQTVKELEFGYLLNGTMSVPKADGNKEYELIKQWIAEGNTPEPEFTEEELAQIEADRLYAEAKATKELALKSVVVTVNGVDYDAHETAINNMSSVVGVAHTKYNQLVANGSSPASAYEAVYKSTIEWKGADNLPHQVQIESVVEALEQAMQKRAEIYGV